MQQPEEWKKIVVKNNKIRTPERGRAYSAGLQRERESERGVNCGKDRDFFK